MKKRTKILIIGAGLFAVVIGVLFLSGTVNRAYLPLKYRSQVASNFKQDFDPVNPRLQQDYGIEFKQTPEPDCDAGYYSASRYIFGCQQTQRAEVVADDTFIAKWKQTSPAFERSLLASGWTKVWNEKQPIDEILDNPQNDGSIGVNYTKTHGKMTCTLTFMWVQPSTPNYLNADETCEVYQRT
jgi:hypothetical protein